MAWHGVQRWWRRGCGTPAQPTGKVDCVREPFESLSHCAEQLTAFNERRWRWEQLYDGANAADLAAGDMATIVAQGESGCAVPDSHPGDTPDEPDSG